jgi:hypothetical protein
MRRSPPGDQHCECELCANLSSVGVTTGGIDPAAKRFTLIPTIGSEIRKTRPCVNVLDPQVNGSPNRPEIRLHSARLRAPTPCRRGLNTQPPLSGKWAVTARAVQEHDVIVLEDHAPTCGHLDLPSCGEPVVERQRSLDAAWGVFQIGRVRADVHFVASRDETRDLLIGEPKRATHFWVGSRSGLCLRLDSYGPNLSVGRSSPLIG